MSLEIEFKPLALAELPACVDSHKEAGFRLVQMLCVNTDEGTDIQYTFMKNNLLENYTIRGVQKGTKVPSVTNRYLSAFVFENEAHDLFGVEIEGNVLDFGGNFYKVAVKEPMTIISPAQKEAREKAAKIAAAKAAKEAKQAEEKSESATGKEGE